MTRPMWAWRSPAFLADLGSSGSGPPQVDPHQVAAIIRDTSGLRDPAVLLAELAPGLRVVPRMPAPGDVA